MQIYVAEGTQHTGPFDLETIKAGLQAGRYQPGQLAWYDGAPGWEPISQLPGLEGFLPPPLPPMPTPTPPPPAPGPYVYPPAAYAPRRRSPWLVAGGIIIGLIALASGIVTLSRGLRSDRADGNPAPTPVASAPAAAPPIANGLPSQPPIAPAVPAVGTRHFAANRARYTGNLAQHFVGFSFDYPDDWTVVENVDDEFLEAHRYVHLPDGSNVAAESMAVSYAYSRPGTALAASLASTGSQLLEMVAASLLNRFPDATKTVPRSGRYGRYPAQEQFVTSPADEEEDRPDRFFRQAIVAQPNSNGTDGLYITISGSGPGGNPSAESLGKSGGLRTIEDSFRFEP